MRIAFSKSSIASVLLRPTALSPASVSVGLVTAKAFRAANAAFLAAFAPSSPLRTSSAFALVTACRGHRLRLGLRSRIREAGCPARTPCFTFRAIIGADDADASHVTHLLVEVHRVLSAHDEDDTVAAPQLEKTLHDPVAPAPGPMLASRGAPRR